MRPRLFSHFYIHHFLLKVGATFSLLLVSVFIVACGSNSDTNTANLGSPPVTVTIAMNSSNSSPTPALPPYSCGAWATQSSPPFGTATVGVYAKFVQNAKTNPNDPNDAGNPQGVGGATATATVLWPDGTETQLTGTTGTDGLVAFPVSTSGRSDAINKITFVIVQFTKDGVPSCTVDRTRAAFFTLVVGNITGSPTATGGGQDNPGPKPTSTPVKKH